MKRNKDCCRRLITSLAVLALVCNCCYGRRSAASSPKMERAQWDAQYSDPREFVKLRWFEGMPYGEVRRLIKKDKLPLLHEMLEDKQYAANWHKIAKLIGFISDDPNSATVLLEYFQRDDTWNWKGIEEDHLGHSRLLGKIDALKWLGMIGGPQSDKVLREAVTEEGASRLAKAWLGDGLLTTSSLFNTTANTIVLIRGRAAMGLALTTKPENIALLKQFYSEEEAYCRANKKKTRLYSEFVSAMVVQDFITTNDREAYLNLLGTPEPRLTALRPHRVKFKRHLKEQKDSSNKSTEQISKAEAKDAAWDAKHSDPREFVKLKFTLGFPRSVAPRLIMKDKLPMLYEMLDDPNYAPYWHNTAKLICYISDDPNSSIPVLLRYFKRDDSWSWKSDDRRMATEALGGKIWSLALIGELGGPQADPILQKAVTEAGAAELTKAWIDKPLVPAMSWLRDKPGAIVRIRYAACRGLIYTQKPDNVKMARQLYETETTNCRATGKRTKLWGYLRYAMAAQDYIAEHGRDAYFSLSITENRAAMSQRAKKYSWELKEDEESVKGTKTPKLKEEAVNQTQSEHKHSDPREFIKLRWHHGMSYVRARDMIKQDQIPLLHAMLEDKDYAPYWHKIAKLIGFVSKDANSVTVLHKYFERDDSWNWKGQEAHNRLQGKIDALQFIGMIGGPEADAVLQSAITQEGASQLARSWLSDGLEPGRGTFSTKVNTVAFIRGRAAMGLVLTDKIDNIDMVKSVYSEIRGPVVKVPPDLYSGIISAMAVHGYIEDNGREKFYQVYFGSHRRVGELRPYIKRYK